MVMVNENQLVIWTVYFNPRAYPEKFVVRKWTGPHAAYDPAAVTDTLEAARAAIPPGLHRMDRQPGDDMCILETWF